MKLSMSIHPSPWGAGILARQTQQAGVPGKPLVGFFGAEQLTRCPLLPKSTHVSMLVEANQSRTRSTCSHACQVSCRSLVFFLCFAECRLRSADCGVLIAELRRESFKWPSRQGVCLMRKKQSLMLLQRTHKSKVLG